MDELKEWVRQLCHYGREDEEFFHSFWSALLANQDIYREVEYYARNGEFLGNAQVCGYTVMDVLVWQIDHFKSHMDRGEYDMQSNPERMVLMAFHTLLEMKKNPGSYVQAMQTETGTDYAEKYGSTGSLL